MIVGPIFLGFFSILPPASLIQRSIAIKTSSGGGVLSIWLFTTGFFYLSAPALFAQGTVDFRNTATTLLMTNSSYLPPPGQLPNVSGPTTGVNTYLIGLYIAPQGTTDLNAFTLVGIATNGTVPINNGRFNGGSAFVIPNNSGQTISFQVRAWSTFAGATFEAASVYVFPFPYLGTSAIGYITPSTNGVPPSPPLFGTGPGQVGGFLLHPNYYSAPNFPPSVSITNPTSGSLFAVPGNVPISISATDRETYVTSVYLFTNGAFAAQVPPPYNMTLSNLVPGYYTLRAQATDSGFLTTMSAPVTVRVASPPVLAFARGSNGPIQFQFNSATGINYVVERGGLTNFSPVITNPGSAGPISYAETNGSATQRTYRVRLQ
jgi:hypothetical protein